MPRVGFEPTISAGERAEDLRLRPRGNWDRFLGYFAASIGKHQSTRRHIPEELSLQQHHCEKLKSRKISSDFNK